MPDFVRFRSFGHRVLGLVVVVLVALSFVVASIGEAAAAGPPSRITEFLAKVTPQQLVPDADRFGAPIGEPPIVPAYAGDRMVGHVYLNSDFSSSIGYSGKPIDMLVGLDRDAVVTGLALVEHKEPIVLIGVPEKKVVEAVNKLIGTKVGLIAGGKAKAPQPDIVSGATVTVLVMADSVVRSAVKLVRSGRLGATPAATAAAQQAPEIRTIDADRKEVRDWDSLVGDGSVRRLHVSVGDINAAFVRTGNTGAAANPEPGAADETFIDLYAALVSVPTIGASLLGEAGWAQLQRRLAPGQHALLIAGDGIYSFKGSGYVRGGVFDRIQIVQDGASARFRDRNHERIGAIEAAGAPELREIGVFVVPADMDFDPTEPWQLQLLVQREIGARDKAFLSLDLGYTLPATYVRRERTAAPPPAAAATSAPPQASGTPAQRATAPDAVAPAATDVDPADHDEPFWKKMWQRDMASTAITLAALLVLTGIFFFQNALVRRPVVYTWVRRAFLLFTLVWLGWYANAQLSVVNILTFTNALMTGFSWEYFLTAPLIFILWSAVAASLLFWGRGPFCGWLCPFGALQELTNTIAKWLRIPQIRVPWGLHERLWPIKYIIFLGLFGVSLHSVALAEKLAEVEPFKTAIVLKFVRDWPFVLFAVALLVAGLFVERFFCRYLCPLGAALAIPGRLRTFEWLRRWPECGSPCHRCAVECPVQSIHPEGHINVNECIYCMHCQELYFDDQRCPHMIQVRLKRERREALTSPSMRGGKGPTPPVITAGGRTVPVPASTAD
ncbi:Putative electron transport protein YccM [Rhodoplanes serenus]|uniref:Electron transport protein YccM n=1 Tax=Rhodoplanes serenus TaxID=200615 RepID=A0A447D1Q6_9BRAD|nr:NosR/NirI family protein [Rhodoplanes serenus]VCU11467.1 Putative electron transport protein YccM [Rhodoplanes serenus]